MLGRRSWPAHATSDVRRQRRPAAPSVGVEGDELVEHGADAGNAGGAEREGWVSGRISPTCEGDSCTVAYPLGGGNTFDIEVDDLGDDVVVSIRQDSLTSRAFDSPCSAGPLMRYCESVSRA